MSRKLFIRVTGADSLLSLAKRIQDDFPYSVTIFNALLLHARGFSKRDRFFTLQQNPTSHVVVWQKGDDHNAVSFHCRQNEIPLLQEALRETTDPFDIRKVEAVYSAPDYIVDAIQESAKNEGVRLLTRPHHTFSYSPEFADVPLRIKPGYEVKRLGRRGIVFLLQSSRYNKNSPIEEMVTFSKKAPFVGVFRKETDEVDEEASLSAKAKEEQVSINSLPVAGDDETPVCCVAATLYGSIGLLYTDEAYRGRGLGSVVMQICARIQADQGLIPHAHVDLNNVPSTRMFEKLRGWSRTHTASWVMKVSGDPRE